MHKLMSKQTSTCIGRCSGFVKESGHLQAEKREGQVRQQEQHKQKCRDMKEKAAWSGRGVAATLRRPTLRDVSQTSHYHLLGK